MGASSGRHLLTSNLLSKAFVVTGSILLARILFPEDYGYLVIAYLFDGIFNLFSISGYETHYIQARGLTDEEDLDLLGACYWLRIRQALLVFIIQLGLGIGLYFYNDETLGLMVGILSFSHIINIFGKTNEAYLSKKLDFKPIAISNFLRDVSGAFTKVLFAVLGFGPLCFVIGQIVSYIFRAGYLMKVNSLRIKLNGKHPEIPNILKFGGAVFFNTVGAYLTQQADAAMVAAFYSKYNVGLYQFARKQSSLPFNFILSPLNPLMVSYISKHKETYQVLFDKFKAAGILLLFVTLPIFMFGYAEIKELVIFVFGEKWIETSDIVRVFLLYYIFQFISYPSGFLPTALGHPAKKARISFICFGFIVIALFILAYFKVHVIYYAIVYVVGYFIKDVWVGLLGFRLLKSPKGGLSYFDFIKDRFSIIYYLLISLTFIVAIYYWNIFIVYKILIFGILQLILIYLSLKYFLRRILFSALRELTDEKIINRLKVLRI